MTKQEVKVILRLIDLYTVTEEPFPNYFEKVINEGNINRLKRDIKEILQDDE